MSSPSRHNRPRSAHSQNVEHVPVEDSPGSNASNADHDRAVYIQRTERTSGAKSSTECDQGGARTSGTMRQVDSRSASWRYPETDVPGNANLDLANTLHASGKHAVHDSSEYNLARWLHQVPDDEPFGNQMLLRSMGE